MKTTETPTPARRRSPIFWVPTAYFGMGLPFVVLNMVAVLMYKGLGVSDAKIAFWTSPYHASLDTETPLESVAGDVPYQEILCRPHPDGIGSHFRVDCLVASSSVLFAITIALFAIVAFSGATHDVACDGVYMDELNAQEQAKYIGWQGAFIT